MTMNAFLVNFIMIFPGTNTIRSSAMDIMYDFVYELNLTCADIDPLKRSMKTSTVKVAVTFISASSLISGHSLSAASSSAFTTATPTQPNTASTSTAITLVLVCLEVLMTVSLCLDH